MLVSKLECLNLRLFDGHKHWWLAVFVDQVKVHFARDEQLSELFGMLHVIVEVRKQDMQ